MAALKLFVKEGCAKCPAAKVVAGELKKDGVRVREYDLDTADGLAEGAFFGVMATPTMLIVDGSDNPVSGWRGIVPGVEEVRSAMLETTGTV